MGWKSKLIFFWNDIYVWWWMEHMFHSNPLTFSPFLTVRLFVVKKSTHSDCPHRKRKRKKDKHSHSVLVCYEYIKSIEDALSQNSTPLTHDQEAPHYLSCLHVGRYTFHQGPPRVSHTQTSHTRNTFPIPRLHPILFTTRSKWLILKGGMQYFLKKYLPLPQPIIGKECAGGCAGARVIEASLWRYFWFWLVRFIAINSFIQFNII